MVYHKLHLGHWEVVYGFDVIPMLEILLERLLFTVPAGKHTLYFIID